MSWNKYNVIHLQWLKISTFKVLHKHSTLNKQKGILDIIIKVPGYILYWSLKYWAQYFPRRPICIFFLSWLLTPDTSMKLYTPALPVALSGPYKQGLGHWWRRAELKFNVVYPSLSNRWQDHRRIFDFISFLCWVI